MSVQDKLLIGGQWTQAQGGETFPSLNPATGEVIAELSLGTATDVELAVQAARQAAQILRGLSVERRAQLCEAVAERITAEAETLAAALTVEQGKPLAEARGEVLTTAKGFQNAAGHIRHLDGTITHAENPARKVLSIRRPRGVYGVVTPWNFPLNIPTEYLAPALATGNAVVWVPAPTTSHIAVLFTELLLSAGIPDGAVNLVTGYGHVVGDAVVVHPEVDAICFTGSSATGRTIAQRGAGKPMLLELGGNGPTIVLDDADLESAARAIAEGAYLNAGQTCAATEVVFVECGVHDQLAELITKETEGVRLGNPSDTRTNMGPLNNEPTADKTSSHIADAVERGAKVLFGGKRAEQQGSPLFFEPTVLAAVNPEAEIVGSETFGPVVPLVPVDSADEAVRLAQNPAFGLSSAVWSRSAARAFSVAERLRAGLVNINESSTYWEIHIPFGGGSGTESGLGRLGGMHTLLAMTEISTITFDPTTF